MPNNSLPPLPLQIISHNVQGLNSPVKRRKILQSFHSQRAAVVMLQETHFPIRYSPSFLHATFPQFYLANAEDKTRGVAILFAKNCQFKIIKTHKDPEGRFILVKGQIEDQLYSFVSYYSPNRGQGIFFHSMFHSLGSLLEGMVIFGGDSNIAFDQSLDKSKPPSKQLTRPTKISSKIA